MYKQKNVLKGVTTDELQSRDFIDTPLTSKLNKMKSMDYVIKRKM